MASCFDAGAEGCKHFNRYGRDACVMSLCTSDRSVQYFMFLHEVLTLKTVQVHR